MEQLLRKHDFRKRKPFKNLAGGKSKFRDEQFKNIKRLKEENLKKGNPVLSMDVKKRTDRSLFERGRTLYSRTSSCE